MAAAAETSLVPPANPQEAPAASNAPASQPPRHSNKSWRKKYYKMRHEFQRLMARNNTQFEEEQKAMRMARRLQEQNDQVLDLLYDINRKPRLDTKLRFDIRSPVPSISPVPELEDDVDELEDILSYNPLRKLSQLDQIIPHTSMTDLPSDTQEQKALEGLQDLIEDEPTGYLSPTHEEEYLAAVDAHEEKPRDYAPSQQRAYDGPAGPWSTRDPSAAAANNPVSVFNWLRKHMPDSLETNDKGPGPASTKEEKAGAKPAPTKVMPKRASVGAKHEYGEVLDDDGTVVRQTPEVSTPSGSGRGRKRALADDDGAYRPKGGSGRKKKKMSVSEKSGFSGLQAASETAPES